MEQGNWERLSLSVDTVGKTNFQLVKLIFFLAYGFGDESSKCWAEAVMLHP